MSKEQINIKGLQFASDCGKMWLEEVTEGDVGKAVVFTSEKEFLDAMAENGKAKEMYGRRMRELTDILKKDYINNIGDMETIVKFLHNGLESESQQQMQDMLREDISIIFDTFVDYCIVSRLHYDEITKKLQEQLFYEVDEMGDESDCISDYIFIDNDAEKKVWFMAEVEDIGYKFMLYKLSSDEQEIMKQQIEEKKKENNKFIYTDNALYVKGCIAILEEIIELFGE